MQHASDAKMHPHNYATNFLQVTGRAVARDAERSVVYSTDQSKMAIRSESLGIRWPLCPQTPVLLLPSFCRTIQLCPRWGFSPLFPSNTGIDLTAFCSCLLGCFCLCLPCHQLTKLSHSSDKDDWTSPSATKGTWLIWSNKSSDRKNIFMGDKGWR